MLKPEIKDDDSVFRISLSPNKLTFTSCWFSWQRAIIRTWIKIASCFTSQAHVVRIKHHKSILKIFSMEDLLDTSCSAWSLVGLIASHIGYSNKGDRPYRVGNPSL